MAREIQYIGDVKIVGRRQKNGDVKFSGKNAKIMELIQGHQRKDQNVFEILRSFPTFEEAYHELKQKVRDAGYWQIDGMDFVLNVFDEEDHLEPGWSTTSEYHVRLNDAFVLVALPNGYDGFLCTIIRDRT